MNAPRGKTIKSKEFDDVYFSVEDGLAETRHVFLDGNNLPKAWNGRDEFVIAETGFGTGLNFLAVWNLFDETAREGQKLHFISVEKYPLGQDDINGALAHWDELSEYRAALCAVYPRDVTGLWVCDITQNVRISVYFGDVVAGLSEVDGHVDAWFLDGFKPSSNPEMWSDAVFAQIKRLARQGTSFATFTSAGFVRRGLMAVGFDVRKIAGFGRKREMSVGVFR